MTEISVTNLIRNGDVTASSDGWKQVTGTLTREALAPDTHVLKLAAVDDQGACFETAYHVPLIASHKYYLRYRIMSNCDADSLATVAWPNNVATNMLLSLNVWHYIAEILDMSSAVSGNYPVQFSIGTTISGQYVYYDKLQLIDLTADFGAGSEPDTAWCNENIPIYFEGRIALPFWQDNVPVFTEAAIVPSTVDTGGLVQLVCKVVIAPKIFGVEYACSNEIYSGEV